MESSYSNSENSATANSSRQQLAPSNTRSRTRRKSASVAPVFVTLHPYDSAYYDYPEEIFVAPGEIRLFCAEVDESLLLTRIFFTNAYRVGNNWLRIDLRSGLLVCESPSEVARLMRGEAPREAQA